MKTMTKKKLAVPPAATPRVISNNISGAAVARLAGLSKQRVSVLLRQGHSAGSIIAQQESKRSAAAAHHDGQDDGKRGKPESWLAARSRKETSLADLRAMEVARRRGELIERAVVDSYVSGAIIYFRDALLRLPSELKDRCDQQPGAVVEALYLSELHRLLTDFARGMRTSEKRAEQIQAAKKVKETKQ